VAVAIPLAAIFVVLGLYNHPAGLGLWCAHTLLALPVAFFLLRTAFRDVPHDLEEAARLDGAGGLGVFWRVSLPLVRPSLAAAALVVFLMSWDEIAYACCCKSPTGHCLPISITSPASAIPV
jgi:ABC-type glycerol-3-phosphate transport system permease component